ncbi:MAG: C_GCAxxG_C_C family protein [Treponema sp.]|nr:C_GCAxxG_C_C family protein [Treponema sp.]
MITPEEARQQARQNFLDGYACAPAVAAVFAEELGYDRDMILRISQPFGAGICRMREVCGTVSGMMTALGMAMGSADGTKESKDRIYAEGQKLAARFRERNGSIICRELLGLVPMGQSEQALRAGKSVLHTADSPVSEARTPEYYKKRPCPDLCGEAAAIFAEWLNERKNTD